MRKKLFILDDEPMFLDWVVDYADSLGCDVRFFTSINEAYVELGNTDSSTYDAFLIDLNVPASAELEAVIKQKPEVFHEFRGLFIAQEARNKGVKARNIIVYSVHDNPAVSVFCGRLGASYIPKGRAKLLKEKLLSLISTA